MASLITIGEGYLFAHRYQIGVVLGKGGMGTVYDAVHVPTARKRALKIMSYLPSGSPTLQQRFTREAQLGARIRSPFIVDVLDAGIDDLTGFPFIAMERLEGEDLARLSRRAGPLPPANVVRYLYQAALALNSCHAVGVVHRDIKPSNLFLAEARDGERRIKLLDLGIAKVVADGEALTTESIGTPAYMAPEQLAAGGKVTAATDSYALAMVAYTLLVGRGYFQDDQAPGSVFALADVIRGAERERATERALRAGVSLPPELDAAFARATAVSPADCHPSAVATVQALAAALGVPLPDDVPVVESSPGPEIFRPFEASDVTTQRQTGDSGIEQPLEAVSLPTRRGGVRARGAWVFVSALAVSALVIPVLAFRRGDPGPRPAPMHDAGATRLEPRAERAPSPVATTAAPANEAAVTVPEPPVPPPPGRRRHRRAARRARAAERPPEPVAQPLYSRD